MWSGRRIQQDTLSIHEDTVGWRFRRNAGAQDIRLEKSQRGFIATLARGAATQKFVDDRWDFHLPD